MTLTEIRAAKEGDELVDDDVRGVQQRRKTFFLYYRTKSGQRLQASSRLRAADAC